MRQQIRQDTGICHFQADASVSLREFLSQIDLSLVTSEKKIEFWLDHGCVYLDGKRQRQDILVHPGQIVRLHTRPKMYERRFQKLSDHLIIVESDFLVLNKPAGLPTHATLDNFKDNVSYILEEELGYPVYTTHRLDIPTQGLLLIARSKKSQATINKLFAQRKVKKMYRAITSHKIDEGQYTHFMNPEGRAPRAVCSHANKDWWLCSMEIKSVECLSQDFVHTIALHTGRTHQIRAQMSYLGAPILGDFLYGSDRSFNGAIALKCCHLEFDHYCYQLPIRDTSFCGD